MALSLNVTYQYCSGDFDFFVVLAKHPKLTAKNGVQLLDVIAKVYFSDVCFANAARLPFMLIVNRFADDEEMHEFVEKVVALALGTLLRLEKRVKEGKKKRKRTLSDADKSLDGSKSKDLTGASP